MNHVRDAFLMGERANGHKKCEKKEKKVCINDMIKK